MNHWRIRLKKNQDSRTFLVVGGFMDINAINEVNAELRSFHLFFSSEINCFLYVCK